ncbi:MAG: nitrilase-related carbon-nitrogen hydrolase [Phycisphaerales bacterium]|nr:nitrilase-related carbon-nitrogen hydrolase [Phycisphaerales bacterium]
MIIAGRIPGYGKHADTLSASEYVDHVVAKKLVDPVLTVQIANGFSLKGLIPEYFPSDSASRGYATFLEWTNFDYSRNPSQRLLAVSRVRLCLVQYFMRRITSFEEFAKQCEFIADVASNYKSDFVLYPELFTTQLLSLIESSRPSVAARKLAEFTPQYLSLFNGLAVRYNMNIIGGSQFTVEGENLYNIAYLFRRDGTIGKQYKIQVTPNEQRWWGVQPGNRVEVFETDRGKIAILICYDSEFPELARVAAAKGAKILFVPFNTDERFGYLRVRHCSQARAIENQMYVAIAGCAGMMPFVDNADMHYAQCAVLIACVWVTLIAVWSSPVGASGELGPSEGRPHVLAPLLAMLRRRATWIGMGIALTAGAGFESVGGLMGSFLLDRGADKQLVGWFFALPVICCMLLGGLAGGWASDRFGHRRTAAWSVGAILASIGGLAGVDMAMSGSALAIMGAAVPIYFLMGVLTASSYALFMDLTDAHVGGTQFSAFMGATNLCEVWSVALAGSLAARSGYPVAFLALGAASLSSIVLLRVLRSASTR